MYLLTVICTAYIVFSSSGVGQITYIDATNTQYKAILTDTSDQKPPPGTILGRGEEFSKNGVYVTVSEFVSFSNPNIYLNGIKQEVIFPLYVYHHLE